jgi:hypothetical protein
VTLLLWLAVTSFTASNDRTQPLVLLEGAFSSCPEPDAEDGYGERAFEFQRTGYPSWTFDMGPRDSFALFRGVFEGHIAHTDPRNLLGPAFHYSDVPTMIGGRNWSAAGVHVNVVRVPGSRGTDEECYSFYVRTVADPRMLSAKR